MAVPRERHPVGAPSGVRLLCTKRLDAPGRELEALPCGGGLHRLSGCSATANLSIALGQADCLVQRRACWLRLGEDKHRWWSATPP